MKRILALICVIVCLCGLCAPAFAANDTVTVHAYVPNDWTDVRVWAWDDNDNNASSTDWPGDLVMTKGDDGWYTVEIPQGFPNMLVNANGGISKTNDINGVDTSKDVWIVVGAGGSHEVFDSKPANTTLPEQKPSEPVKIDSLGIVGENVPGLQNWIVEDAAGDMTKESAKVYSKVIAFTAGTSTQFKFAANHTWDVNFGGAAEGVTVKPGTSVDLVPTGQNLALSVDKDCSLKFTVTLTNSGATLKVEEIEEQPGTQPENPGTTVPDGEMITVYARVPADWTTVLLWAWDDNDNNVVPGAEWPGTLAMTKGEDDWYSVQIPLGFTNMLVTNGEGAQSADLKGLEAGKDIYIDALTDLRNPTAYYEKVEIKEPEPIVPPTGPSRPPVVSTEPAGTGEAKTPADNTVLFSVIGSVIVIGIAAAVYFILKKKQA